MSDYVNAGECQGVIIQADPECVGRIGDAMLDPPDPGKQYCDPTEDGYAIASGLSKIQNILWRHGLDLRSISVGGKL